MVEIYIIINKVTAKCYIGISRNAAKRFKRHQTLAENGVNRRLYDSMRKYGINNFEMHVLKTYEKWEDGCELEKYLIKQLQTLNPLGYNMTAGGDGGNTLAAWSEGDKRVLYEQQANSRRGKKRSEETKQKISKSHMGKTIPLEQRKRQSETA